MFGENRRIWMEHVPRCKQCHQLSKLQVTVTGKQLYKKLLRKLHQHLSLTTYLGLSKTNDVQRTKSTSTPPVPDFCFLPIAEVPGGTLFPEKEMWKKQISFALEVRASHWYVWRNMSHTDPGRSSSLTVRAWTGRQALGNVCMLSL